MKEKDLEFIKGFSKINVASICKKLNIDRSNLLKGTASSEKTKAVKDEIIKQIEELTK